MYKRQAVKVGQNHKQGREVEHNIILDLSSSLDQVIYKSLVFSSYFCTSLNPKQAKCSQFKTEEDVATRFKSDEIYSYESESGKALKIYQTKEGIAHLELQENKDATLYRYTFTSVEKASDFATKNEKFFKTENFNWDVSYLDYIL